MSRRNALIALVIIVVGAAIWAMLVALPRRVAPQPETGVAAGEAPATAERRITATLYFVSEDGLSLVGVTREVPFGEPNAEQARHIIEAQLGGGPEPLTTAIPEGTTLRALFISERGDAFVDLSADARANHRGGSLDELFTVYTIVNALTVNLPAITRVQILVEGQEVDTLAGHVDLRNPLRRGLKWMEDAQTAEPGIEPDREPRGP
jgi:spore germination protein GerM